MHLLHLGSSLTMDLVNAPLLASMAGAHHHLCSSSLPSSDIIHYPDLQPTSSTTFCHTILRDPQDWEPPLSLSSLYKALAKHHVEASCYRGSRRYSLKSASSSTQFDNAQHALAGRNTLHFTASATPVKQKRDPVKITM